MRYLQTYKLFESVSDDAYDKWIKAKTEYDAKISELKAEYLEGVKQCMFDLTDSFNHTSSVTLDKDFRPNSGGDLVAKFKFKVPTNRIDEFFDTLEEMEETVKSYISEYRRIQISYISFRGGLYRQNAYSLKDIRERIEQEIKKYESDKLNLVKSDAKVEIAGVVIEVEI